jgi:hypothetical protein
MQDNAFHVRFLGRSGAEREWVVLPIVVPHNCLHTLEVSHLMVIAPAQPTNQSSCLAVQMQRENSFETDRQRQLASCMISIPGLISESLFYI